MFHKITPVCHGKHNNLHLNIRLGGNKKRPIMIFRLVLFFDYELACISNSNIHYDLMILLNYKKLERVINDYLSELDVKLYVFSYRDFFHRNVKSEFLLNRLKEKQN